MKVKTADLIGSALDWAVAQCLGLSVVTVTVEDQAAEHERVMRDLYSDAEWYEHLIGWNKYVRPTLRTHLAALDSDGFPNGNPFMQNGRGVPLAFSTDWSQGGPLIQREEIGLRRNAPCSRGREWEASPSITAKGAGGKWGYGPTPLIAACRCLVASRFGDEIEIPDELV